ncbi:MAG: serine/threonine protein kinase [Deltaproteobacteria bacterium]|nr:MAG: serine/threonine protein kinase [Deltaproteobacteria bacterium]
MTTRLRWRMADHGTDPLTRRYDDGTTEVVPGRPAPAEAAGEPPASGGSGRYVLGAEIARGGMGRVVVGTDTRLGREVAIKEALARGDNLERFEREVRITARLEHPSIVPLYDAGIAPSGQPFYVMRKVSGQPLDRLILERSFPGAGPRGALDERLALLPHVLAAAHALGHAHRRGVIHRDIKPANILVGELGETVVIDWGLAKVIGESEPPPIDAWIAPSGEVATQTGAVFGTPGFMAPEQARSEALDARSDVYALGATLYHVLAGQPPTYGSLGEVVARAHDEQRADAALAALAALPLPPELTAIVAKAMQFDPARRYADGAALADDLNRFLAGRLVSAHRYTRGERLRRLARRHRALVAVIAGSALVLATGGGLAIRGILRERERAQQAEQAALAGQRAAETARERETDRADDAVILKARGELERDPTAAIATLATLGPASRRWAQARPITVEAKLRGIAHVYRADRAARAFAIGPDTTSLLVSGSDNGEVSIIDLAHDRQRLIATCPGHCEAAWGEGGAVIWIAPQAGGLYALELATGVRRAAVMDDAITHLRADPAASHVAFALRGGGGGWLDTAGVHRRPEVAGKVETLEVSPDGTWMAFATARELVVIDREGRVLARETGAIQPTSLVRAASGRQLAVLGDRRDIVEIEIASGRATTRRLTPAWQVIWLAYVRDLLYVNLRNAREMRPLHDLDNRGAEQPHVWWWNYETWQGRTVVATDTLQLLGPITHVLQPPVHDPPTGLTARRDSRYVAMHVRGAILTWNVGDVLPDVIADDVIEWLDLTTRVRTPIALPRGVVIWQRPDPATGRQLLLVQREGAPDLPVIARPGRSEVSRIDVPGLRRIDLAGPGLVAGTAAGELVLIADGAPPRVVHRFDEPVEVVLGNASWILAETRSSQLARYNRATGALDATRSPFRITGSLVGRTGDIYLANARELVRWRGRGFDHIATLPSPVLTLDDIDGRNSLVVTTDQHAVYAIDPDLPEPQRVTRLFFRSATLPKINATGRYLAVDSNNGETTLLDLAHGTRWKLPSLDPLNTISPSGRTLLQFAGKQLVALHLDVPDDPQQLRAWILDATNYTLDTSGP